MKKIPLGIFILFISSSALAGNKWNVTLPGGLMRFQGEVIAEACDVETGNRQMIVNMGSVSSNRFKYLGDTANPVAFEIRLQNCKPEVRNKVSVSFWAAADGKSPNVISNGEGESFAQGIGIGIFDDENKIIPINTFERNWKKINKGITTFNFTAKYIATSKVVSGGIVNSQAWFALTYL
ncbi:fimbrial protein [Pantoea sp. Mb-10]|uniref:fimbrial protein n=1 Tax=unclassified Pantoea TaxID=2630326 RepID=UPI001E3FF0E1|nr:MULTISPECIES: fimbrial protein [unclassified Pantoea]MCE0491277.1 fimbrial protein [Pantoea sp. Mb-10]MCE0502766.1 fimbrial protein [Pantoea sp. Pb-8]